MDHKLNIVSITEAWPCCNYKLVVRVDRSKDFAVMKKHLYIEEILKKWFGSAEYFWDDCWLVDRK